MTGGVKKGFNIEVFSVAWMVIEAAIAIGAGILAHSLVLVVFGADSIIELVAGSILLWRLWVEMRGASLEQVQRAEEIASLVVGISLLLLAVYITVSGIYNLWTHSSAEFSPLGIGLALIAVFSCSILPAPRKILANRLAVRH